MDKLLIVGDAGCDTGFARVVHELTKQLCDRWEVHILAINYFGDPHQIQKYAYLYPAGAYGSHPCGFDRFEHIVKRIQPQSILIVNDPWVAVYYVPVLQQLPDVKKVLYTPIDSEHVKKAWVEPLDVFDEVVSYTKFGKQELLLSGLEKKIHVIPHGINTSDFYPIDKHALRAQTNISADDFIVQYVGRNSLRKRQDLFVYYFSEWIKQYGHDASVKFYYHGDLHDSGGYDITDLAHYYDVDERFIKSPQHTAASGVPIEMMNAIYNIADVHVSTSQAEG